MKRTITLILTGTTALLLLLTFTGSFFTIEPGQVGVVKRLGNLEDDIREPGVNFKFPFIDTAVKMDIRNRKIEGKSQSASQDLQIVTSTIAVNYSIDRTRVIDLYTTVGREYDIENVLIRPVIEESIKSATAKFNASDLITKRDDVRNSITGKLEKKLSERGLVINDVNITDFEFSKEFDRAIEQKVKAEQEALKAKEDLERVKFEAQQQIEKSKAEAEKIRIQAEAITKQGGEEYVKLQWIEKWNGQLPSTMLSDGSNMLINLK
ncbi:MAG: prohibitin family protein [Candidatus Gracilibacteria bacterium]|nr:prohibitin family protein [Candidatus Gracilibacteria bacterium]